MKFLIMYSCPSFHPTVTSNLLRSKYSPQHTVPKPSECILCLRNYWKDFS